MEKIPCLPGHDYNGKNCGYSRVLTLFLWVTLLQTTKPTWNNFTDHFDRYNTRLSVARGKSNLSCSWFALGSYQSDPKEALRPSTEFMKESGGHAVNLEGGKKFKESIKKY
jgi:hypothetical protein